MRSASRQKPPMEHASECNPPFDRTALGHELSTVDLSQRQLGGSSEPEGTQGYRYGGRLWSLSMSFEYQMCRRERPSWEPVVLSVIWLLHCLLGFFPFCQVAPDLLRCVYRASPSRMAGFSFRFGQRLKLRSHHLWQADACSLVPGPLWRISKASLLRQILQALKALHWNLPMLLQRLCWNPCKSQCQCQE